MHAWRSCFIVIFCSICPHLYKGPFVYRTNNRKQQVMEGGSSHNSSESTEQMSELETLQRQHEEKLSRIRELKGKREAMVLELEKQKNENPQKMKDFNELTESYNSRRDQLLSLVAERSQESKK